MENNLDIKKLLGKRIKELRTRKNLTQAQLAETVDIAERTLSKIECGQTFVTADTLAKIITALEVEPAELFNFKHLEEKEILKDELITAIKNEEVDIPTLYRIYKSLK